MRRMLSLSKTANTPSPATRTGRRAESSPPLPGFRFVNAHADGGGVVVKSFKQALHPSVAAAQDHDVVSKEEVGYIDICSKRNLWVTL